MKMYKKGSPRHKTVKRYVRKVFELALAELLSAAIVGGIYMGIHATGGEDTEKRCLGKMGPNVDRITLTFCIDRREDVSKVCAEVGQQMSSWLEKNHRI
jgi:hypothetical protein